MKKPEEIRINKKTYKLYVDVDKELDCPDCDLFINKKCLSSDHSCNRHSVWKLIKDKL